MHPWLKQELDSRLARIITSGGANGSLLPKPKAAAKKGKGAGATSRGTEKSDPPMSSMVSKLRQVPARPGATRTRPYVKGAQ